jgi:hypothetical protein
MKTDVSRQSVWLHKLHTASPARHKRLVGEWKGYVWPQNIPQAPKQILVYFRFKAESTEKVIMGEMWFHSPDKSRGRIENYLVGGFLSENELQFLYSKKEDAIQGWGAIHFTLSPDASRLDGDIVGLSSHSGKHFHSKIALRKGTNVNLRRLSAIKVKPRRATIFISHGGNAAWKEVEKYIRKSGYAVETFEAGARAGKTISEVLSSMMVDSAFAIFVMTGEDKMSNGKLRARQNVIHEIGLFQGGHSINRAALLIERGVEDFSNIRGIAHLPFKRGQIRAKFKDILRTIQREFPAR